MADLSKETLQRLHEAATREADDVRYYGGPTSAHLPHADALANTLINSVPAILKLLDEHAEMREVIGTVVEDIECAAGCDEGAFDDAVLSEVLSWGGSPMLSAYSALKAALANQETTHG